MSAPSSALALPEAARAEIAERARASYPDEACGLLIGRREGARTAVVRSFPARNASERRRDRYDLDPRDHLAAEGSARAAGLEVVGVWHSHPGRPARPSATDGETAWAGWSYLIVSVGAAGVREMRSWRWSGSEFVEEVLEA